MVNVPVFGTSKKQEVEIKSVFVIHVKLYVETR